jgi:hypothetical protein
MLPVHPTAEAVPTVSALERRVRRALKHQDQTLRRTRGERQEIELGDYFVIDTQRNIITLHHCNPEALGRELGVFA